MDNDPAPIDPFSDVLPFVLTAETKSFRGAAKRLGVTPSAVSRAVARLESAVGVRLLARTSRVVRPTPEGEVFLARCQVAVETMQRARNQLAALQEEPAGRLRVSLPMGFGRAVVLPRLAAFCENHPAIRLHVGLTDRFVDLARENVDVAVRIGELTDSTLVARRVDRSRFVTIAAPAYLARFGRPRGPTEWEGHRCLMYQLPNGRLRQWVFRLDGEARTISVRPFLTLDLGESLVDLVSNGVGVGHVPDYLAQRAIADGAVVELFEDASANAGDVWCVRAPARHPTAAVRAFVQMMATPSANR